MYRLFQGVGAITVLYFVTLAVAVRFFSFVYGKRFDLDWDLSGWFIGALVMTIPYIAYGFLTTSLLGNAVRHALNVSLITVIGERISIYLIGLYLSASHYGNREPLAFIRGEAAPYFTPFYILIGGVISVMLCVIAAWLGTVRRKAAVNHL